MLSDSYLDALLNVSDGSATVPVEETDAGSSATVPNLVLQNAKELSSSSEDEYQTTDISDDDDETETDEPEVNPLSVETTGTSKPITVDMLRTEPASEVPLAHSVETDYVGVNFSDFKSMLSENTEMDDLVSEYGYRNIFNELDQNGDGILTADEVKRLHLSTDVVEDLTVDDIKKIAKSAGLPDIEDSDDSETKTGDKEDSETETELSPDLVEKLKKAFGIGQDTDTTDTTPAVESTGAVTPTYSSGGVSGGGGGSYSSGGGSGSTTAAATQPEQMSMDQLLQEQAAKQADVDARGQDVAAVQSGENANVAAAKADCDEKEKAYEEALEKDEQVSDELKQEQKENQEQIDENNEKIEENNKIIAEADNTISDCKSQISIIDSEIKALNASKSNLPAKTEENKDRHSEIDAMARQIEDKIEDANKRKDDLEQKIKDAEDKKDEAQDIVDECEENLKTLEEERDRIEKEILETCSDETKQALEDFQKARDNIETVRSDELQKAQTALETAQQELEKVNDSIKELQEMQIQLENRVGDSGEDVVDFALKLDGMSAAEMKQIMRAAGCQFDDGAWCADFVTYVTKQVYGVDSTPGDFAHSCANTAYCPTIESWAQNKGVWTTDSSQVKPGDYILYTRNGRAGHVGIVTSVNPDGSVNTIEGNTSDDNGRYTNGVVNQHTNVKTARGFVLMHTLI